MRILVLLIFLASASPSTATAFPLKFAQKVLREANRLRVTKAFLRKANKATSKGVKAQEAASKAKILAHDVEAGKATKKAIRESKRAEVKATRAMRKLEKANNAAMKAELRYRGITD